MKVANFTFLLGLGLLAAALLLISFGAQWTWGRGAGLIAAGVVCFIYAICAFSCSDKEGKL